MLAGQTQARLGGPSQVQLNPRLLPNNLNAPQLLVGARQPIQRVGNFSPSKNVPLASARGTMPNRPQQLSPARRQSSFLTYPGQLSQQRIAGQAIGLGRVPPTPVPGPTIHWPTARHSFLGSVHCIVMFRWLQAIQWVLGSLAILTILRRVLICCYIGRQAPCTVPFARQHTQQERYNSTFSSIVSLNRLWNSNTLLS